MVDRLYEEVFTGRIVRKVSLGKMSIPNDSKPISGKRVNC